MKGCICCGKIENGIIYLSGLKKGEILIIPMTMTSYDNRSYQNYYSSQLNEGWEEVQICNSCVSEIVG